MPTETVTWIAGIPTPAQHFDDRGNGIDGKTVPFETSTGYSGSIWVSDAVFANPNQVKQMIGDEVSRVVAIPGLSGSVQV